MELASIIRKYANYVFERDPFRIDRLSGDVSAQAFLAARQIRGPNRPSSIMIHGITKRSGTVFTGELLGLHPEVFQHPNRIWEIPFLPLSKSIVELQEQFFLGYEGNLGRISENDFLPLFGSSFVAYLYSMVPDGKRLLAKMPGVQYLDYFPSVFPSECLLVLVRDGRDVVTSTIKTWPQLRFSDVCRRWDRSAKMILHFDKLHGGAQWYWLGKFEDAVREPAVFVSQVCNQFGLDVRDYPFDQIESLPVLGSSTAKERSRSWIKRPEGFNPIGRWHDWNRWQKRTFKRIAGNSLLKLGYCSNLDW